MVNLDLLRRRLDRLRVPEPQVSPLRQRLRRYVRQPHRPDPHNLARRLGAVLLDQGRLLGLEREFPTPGRFVEHAALLTLGQMTGPLDLQEVVFLDLESTGTSFGLGNLPFLVAVGFFHHGTWTVRQYLLPDPAHEPLLHRRLATFLHRFSVVATYNGKSFDLRLLEHRWRYFGVPVPQFEHHLDVYHVVRRFLPPGQPAHLKAAEAEIAGIRREHDLPSHEVPAAYFAYLHRGRVEDLRRVILHNRWDVYSLPWILQSLDRRVMQGLEAPDPWTLFALGRLYERMGQVDKALRFYRRAAVRSLGDLRLHALVRMARQLQRERRYDEAEDLWLQILQERPGHPEALLQLAKHYEHRRQDLHRALSVAVRLPDGPEKRRRLARLHRKLERKRGKGSETPALLRE